MTEIIVSKEELQHLYNKIESLCEYEVRNELLKTFDKIMDKKNMKYPERKK